MKVSSLKLLCTAAVLILLSACGGGGGGGGGGSVTNQSPGGIWRGAVTSSETGLTTQSIGLISEVGELRFLDEDGEQSVGNITVSGSSYSANITSYAPIGQVFNSNGLSVISGIASGTINEKTVFSGSASYAGSVASTFSFTYDSLYERGSSLAAISGVYSESDGFGYTETYAIDSLGVVTGSDTDGCQFNGNVQLIEAAYNLYRINLTVTSCGLFNDSYIGMAVLMDDGGVQNDTLAISISGSEYIIAGSIPRT